MSGKTILLAGGYGLVGAMAARTLRAAHADVTILIGGRNPEKGEALARELGNARAVKLDMTASSPLAALTENIDAVFCFVHDREDRMLKDAMARGMAYGDITRGPTEQLRAYVTAATAPRVDAPVLFTSNWMAGVPSVLAMHMAQDFSDVASVDLSILYYGADKTGPDSGDAASSLAEPIAARIRGNWVYVPLKSDGRAVTFPSGLTRSVYRMSMADVTTLAQATGARDLAVRLGLDNTLSLTFMRAMLKLGLWPLIAKLGGQPGQISGKGAAHELMIEVAGTLKNGTAQTKRLTVLDPKGQAHLTALGALNGIEAMLGLGREALRAGVAVPETAPDAARLLMLLNAEGVKVEIMAL